MLITTEKRFLSIARVILVGVCLFFLLLQPATCTEPLLRFVQWNDMHLKDHPLRIEKMDYLISSTNAETYFPLPDFVLGVGDMVDTGSVAEFNMLNTRLSELSCPFYPVMGNHENSAQEGNPAYEQNYVDAFGADRLNYTFQAGGIEFVMLNDSGAPGSNGTPVGAARRQWLQGVLDATPGVPKIICAHVPLVSVRDEAVLAQSFGYGSHQAKDSAMLNIVNNHADDVIAVLSGHLHLTGVVQRNGIYHITPSGTKAYPCDFAEYQVFEDHISVQIHSLPEEMQEATIARRSEYFGEYSVSLHGRPRHSVDYTDSTHPTFESYICGNPSERSFDISLIREPPEPPTDASDDFNVDHLYWNGVSSDLSDTVWDGMQGLPFASSIDANMTNSGRFTISHKSTANSYLPGPLFDAAALYLEVSDNIAFEAKVQMPELPDDESYLTQSLAVWTQDQSKALHIDNLQGVSDRVRFRDMVSPDEYALTMANPSWFRLTHDGNGVFEAFFGEDGETWTSIGTIYRDDFSGTLRVGPAAWNIMGVPFEAQFDNFQLDIVPEPEIFVLLISAIGAFFARRCC